MRSAWMPGRNLFWSALSICCSYSHAHDIISKIICGLWFTLHNYLISNSYWHWQQSVKFIAVIKVNFNANTNMVAWLWDPVGSSFTTYPKPKGQPWIPLPTQANLINLSKRQTCLSGNLLSFGFSRSEGETRLSLSCIH